MDVTGVSMLLSVVLPIVISIVVIVSVFMVIRVVRNSVSGAIQQSRGPSITGTALRGTARVLSVQQAGSIKIMSELERYTLVLALRVELPGRQPYDVQIRQGVPLTMMAAMQPGLTIPVEVDSANPQNVRVDLSQPITPVVVQPSAPVAPAVAPPQVSVAQRLQDLETLRATGAISDAEYTTKREQIIKDI